MSTNSEDSDSGAGCLLVCGVIAIGIGCGYLWGRGIGWLVIGTSCVAVVALSVTLRGWSAWRQRRK